MDKKQMNESIEGLLNKELKELVVNKNDFLAFREVWINHESKNQLIGEAKHEGVIVYRLKEEKEKEETD